MEFCKFILFKENLLKVLSQKSRSCKSKGFFLPITYIYFNMHKLSLNRYHPCTFKYILSLIERKLFPSNLSLIANLVQKHIYCDGKLAMLEKSLSKFQYDGELGLSLCLVANLVEIQTQNALGTCFQKSFKCIFLFQNKVYRGYHLHL